jgi:hypothetical protein
MDFIFNQIKTKLQWAFFIFVVVVVVVVVKMNQNTLKIPLFSSFKNALLC